jgi:hypothetical protein
LRLSDEITRHAAWHATSSMDDLEGCVGRAQVRDRTPACVVAHTRCVPEEGTPRRLLMTAIASSRARFVSMRPPRIGTRIEIEVYLPGKALTVSITAIVTAANLDASDPWGCTFDVAFNDLDDARVEQLEALARERRGRGWGLPAGRSRAERRGDARVKTDLPAVLRPQRPAADMIECRAVNLSIAGALLDMAGDAPSADLQVGAMMTLCIDPSERCIETDTQIVRLEAACAS